MTSKSQYTSEQWETLRMAPINAAMYVVTAEPSIVGTFVELRAFGKALRQPSAPPAAQDLVSALLADLEDTEHAKAQSTAAGDQGLEDYRQRLYESLKSASAVVDAICSPAEAAGFKQWLLDLAKVAAKAHKKGGVLGIGGVRVSDKEKAALAEIKEALGL